MGLRSLVALALLAINVCAQQAQLPSYSRYIVQFSDVGSAKFRKRDGNPDTEGFFSSLKATGTTAKPALNFTSDVFHGASFTLEKNSGNSSTKAAISQIQALPEVEKIWPVASLSLPVIFANESTNTTGSLARWDSHNLTGVDQVQQLGYDGRGAIVAIVDTGLDYTHPALGGGFGPGFKVEGGWDLVGDTWQPGDVPVPDSDPLDCNGHGTHVAGILGSSDDSIPGVAPEATLRSYKVFGCSGSTEEDIVVQGFIQAFEEGADIITASLGSDQGFPDTPLAVTVTNIQARGVFVSIAAGNSGANGPFYTSSGSNGFGATAVGSIQHTQIAGYTANAHSSSGESREIVYVASNGQQWQLNGTFPSSFRSNDRTVDSCNIWLSDNPIADEDVLVVPRGNCSWQLMDNNVFDGAKWVFYWNFEGAEWEIPSRVVYNTAQQATGFALISYEDGDWLVSQQEQNFTVNFDFEIDGAAAVGIADDRVTAGAINTFSSWGPTLDGRLKPDISAPGGAILSTWPVSKGSWQVLSGTSMATPFIAGVAALFTSAKGGRTRFGSDAGNIVHNRIVNSGKSVLNPDGSGNLASVAQQGAGLVDAFKVVTYDTTVSPAIISLNDTDHFRSTHTIEIKNQGSVPVIYQISHDPGASIITTNPVNWVAQVPATAGGNGSWATAKIRPAKLEVPPGGRGSFVVEFEEPSSLNATFLPVYGGSINVVGSNRETVKVTYAGIKGSLHNAVIWELNRGVPEFLSPNGGLVKANETYNLGNDFAPVILFNILWGTKEFSFDLVDEAWQPSDWTYPPVADKNNWRGPTQFENSLDETPVYLPILDMPRSLSSFEFAVKANFSHGGPIPNGRYKILGRTLKSFGDSHNITDWQYLTSPVFNVDSSF